MRRTPILITSVLALAVLVLAGCSGNGRNYREGTGILEGETRATEGTMK
jgi:hypothetical protein